MPALGMRFWDDCNDEVVSGFQWAIELMAVLIQEQAFEKTYLLIILFAYRYLCESTSLLTQICNNGSSINSSDGRLLFSQQLFFKSELTNV